MPSLLGWLLGRPSHGAYFVNKYAPWLLTAVPYAARALPYALGAYYALTKFQKVTRVTNRNSYFT